MENTTNRPALTETKATIYFRGEMMGNIHKIEVRSFSVEVRPYAQYSAAIEARFVKKGGRQVLGFVQSYAPSLVVVEGWGHPDAAPIFGPAVERDGVTVFRGRHSSCSPEWATEFDALLAAHVASTGAKILHDFRGHNPHGRAAVSEAA
jgi:hypothetical protein